MEPEPDATRKEHNVSNDDQVSYGNTRSITWTNPFPVNEVLVKEQPAPAPQPQPQGEANRG